MNVINLFSGQTPVIVNPEAHRARARTRLQILHSLEPRARVLETRAAGDARRMARELSEMGVPVIAAAGGDGTVNEVVNGIAEAGGTSHTALGVLPMGTMNVLAAEMKLPSSSLQDCWEIITHGKRRAIDLWAVNGKRFIQLAGAGMDAAIIRKTSWERKRRLGAFGYVLSGMQLMLRRMPVLTITAPGRPPLTGTAVMAGNGQLYGGPFRLFPGATVTDGFLDVVVMHGQSPRHFLAVARALLTGGHAGGGELVTYFQTNTLTVESMEPVWCEADGELAV